LIVTCAQAIRLHIKGKADTPRVTPLLLCVTPRARSRSARVLAATMDAAGCRAMEMSTQQLSARSPFWRWRAGMPQRHAMGANTYRERARLALYSASRLGLAVKESCEGELAHTVPCPSLWRTLMPPDLPPLLLPSLRPPSTTLVASSHPPANRCTPHTDLCSCTPLLMHTSAHADLCHADLRSCRPLPCRPPLMQTSAHAHLRSCTPPLMQTSAHADLCSCRPLLMQTSAP